MSAPPKVSPFAPALFLAVLGFAACAAPESTTEVAGVSRMLFSSERDGNPEIYVSAIDGSDPVRLTFHPASDVDPDISPDGRRVVFASDRTGDVEIFAMDIEGGEPTNLTNDAGQDSWPRWSPDGTRIVFHSDRDGQTEIYLMNADGSGLTRVTTHDGPDVFAEWFPDGSRLLFRRDANVWSARPDGSEALPLTDHPEVDQMAVATADGQQVVFASMRDGYCAIYVINADGSNLRKLIPEPQDTETPESACHGWPALGRDGRIYFSASTPETGGENEIFVMEIDGTGVTRLTYSPGADTAPRPF